MGRRAQQRSAPPPEPELPPGAPRPPLRLAGVDVQPGEHRLVDLHVTRRYTHSEVVVPVHVVHGRLTGPCLLVCAAIHGDEINGVEVIRRLLKLRHLRRLRGTLIAVPVVNVHGFMARSRYLPDRRDLNRSFPGSLRGSLASRLAKLLMDEVISKVTHGIDLHTGSNHRRNLPQVRANLQDRETARLARAFGVQVLLHSRLRDGSLRQAAAERGVPLLVYEGGEALRFDEVATRAALRGILGVMRELEMMPNLRVPARAEPFLATSSMWVRAPESGVLLTNVALGATVEPGEFLGMISDPYGQTEVKVTAPIGGVVIGRLDLPLVNEGDALFHIAAGKVAPPRERAPRPAEAAADAGEPEAEAGDLPPHEPVSEDLREDDPTAEGGPP